MGRRHVYSRHPMNNQLVAMTEDFIPLDVAAYERAKAKPIQVATRCSAHHSGTALAGTVAGHTFRWAHVMKTEATQLQFVFANFYPTVTTESSNANAITIAVVLEYNGTYARLFFNGSRQKLIDQGGIAITDPITRKIPVGATFYTRVWVSVPVDGNTYPQGLGLVTSLGDGKAAGDVTLATGAIAASTEVGFGPSAIIGVPVNDGAVAFALVGDSMVGDANGDGWPVQAVQNDYGYMILSRPGSNVQTMEQNSANAYRLRLLQYATHVIVTFGANDFNGAPTFAVQEGYIKDLWKILQDMGLDVYHSTTTPRSTSTDGWNTEANQTTYNGNGYKAKREQFNANLRNHKYPVRVLDVAAVVEAGVGKDIWKGAYTGDGIHPLPAAKAAMLANIDLAIK